MEKNIRISMLCQVYGKLLTKKQKNILENYYNKDFSLSEIAENEKITRQAVRDILKKGEKKLFELEGKLNIMEKQIEQEEKIALILAQIINIQNEYSDAKIATILDNVKKDLNCLV